MGKLRWNYVLRLTPALLLVAAIGMLACCEGMHGPTEADLSAFGTYVYALDTAQMEQQLAQTLEADTSRHEADKASRKHYRSAERLIDAPLWFTRMGVSPDADSLLAILRREVPRCGLDSAAFFLPQIAEDLFVVHKLAFDSLGIDINELLPRLDYNLTRAYVRYATGQRYGFIRPSKLFNNLDLKTHGDGFARLFDDEVEAPDYEASLQQLATDERLDFLAASTPSSTLFLALQQRFAAASDTAERRKLAVNMERSRWQMKHPDEERHVLVNLPSQQLWAVDADTIVNMRICYGATATKTPLLHSAISTIDVNPDWIIPQSIVKNEIARHGGDSSYFARHRYYIADRSTGNRLNPRHVSAETLESGRLRVGQRGGAGNSLGRIVFRFPNNFAVYLHDTNNRSAFSRERRALSHGCVRVERPFDLACFLMPEADEWAIDRLRISIDLPPKTERGADYLTEHAEDEKPYRLMRRQSVSPRVPVYIIYYTAYPNPATGDIELWPDVYGYDKVIAGEMGAFLIKE